MAVLNIEEDELYGQDGHVVTPTLAQVEALLHANQHVLLEVYAPWCKHCLQLKELYKRLAAAFKDEQQLVVAAVDGDRHESVVRRLGIKGFPTILLFPAGTSLKAAVEYQGGYESRQLLDFVKQHTNLTADMEPFEDDKGVRAMYQPPSKVKMVTAESFNSVVDGSTHVMLKFYAPWCPHCHDVETDYEKVANTFLRDPDVTIAAVDGEQASNLVSHFKVDGYPTFLFFTKGSRKWREYKGPHSSTEINHWLAKRTGYGFRGTGKDEL